MVNIDFDHTDSISRGARPSLVESFEINGLYGYRSVSLSSQFAASILIAKNGSGKTTLLGALDAFLKSQFSRLRDIQFSDIRCKIRNIESTLILNKEDINDFLTIAPESDIIKSARKLDITPSRLFKFITEDYEEIRDDYASLSENTVFSSIVRNEGYRHADALSACDKLRTSILDKNEKISDISKILRSTLMGVDVIYLPTYRRIELPLIGDSGEQTTSRKKKTKFKFTGSSLYSGDIQFGLADISERLSDLNQTILVESNFGYRKISANIINELIDGTFEKETTSAKDIPIPNKDELSLFFSRLKDGRRVRPFNDLSVPNIDKIYTGTDIPWDTNKFLRYFLSKLDTVIKSTKDIESRVEDFITNCNKYLSSLDQDADTKDHQLPLTNEDNKVLRMNRRNLKVHVESIATGRKISLDALSSGEKQMVSLFAKLFLYPNEKIVLIDEPELSLSIDWQRQILVDVINAPSCRQIVAITHSPFVFDNELEPFARSLKLTIDFTTKPLQIEDDEEEIDE